MLSLFRLGKPSAQLEETKQMQEIQEPNVKKIKLEIQPILNEKAITESNKDTPATVFDNRDRDINTLYVKSQYRLPVTNETIPVTVEKKKGQNKSKERATFTPKDSVQLCFAIANGENCSRDVCKFSHDVQSYLEAKGEDLGPECPNIAAFGTCRYGFKCRFMGGHDKVPENSNELPDESLVIRNGLSRDFQKSIRSKKDLKLSKSIMFEKVWNEVHSNPKAKKQSPQPDQANEMNSSHSEKVERFELDVKDVRLRPQEKKRIDFRGKSYLAPLTTVGNLPFRLICKQFGVDITCAEMAMSQPLLQGIQSEWALMKRHKNEDLFGVQITGNHPVSFSRLCELIDQNMDVDFVDINIGCPVDAITSRGCGSALMERKSKLREMVLLCNYGI